MANLKEVRIRIGSVKTTQQITKAMKLVAASKLKRAQDRIVQMRPYADKLSEVLSNLSGNVDLAELELNYAEERPIEKVLVVLITSDKGLCGGFNANLIKKAKHIINEKYADQNAKGNVTLMTLGKKGYDAYKNAEIEIDQTHQQIFGQLEFSHVSDVAEEVMEAFSEGKYDVVECVYSKFKTAASQEIMGEQFLPVSQIQEEGGNQNASADYIFEPKQEELVKELVPKILKTQFYRYLLDSNASEHGARMIAMDKASENANELLNDLKLLYNKERQAAITKEILEIVGGAAALEEG